MQYHATNNQYILRIGRGELAEVMIHEFCNRHEIKNALVQGIGAAEFVRCGYYDLEKQEYVFKEGTRLAN